MLRAVLCLVAVAAVSACQTAGVRSDLSPPNEYLRGAATDRPGAMATIPAAYEAADASARVRRHAAERSGRAIDSARPQSDGDGQREASGRTYDVAQAANSAQPAPKSDAGSSASGGGRSLAEQATDPSAILTQMQFQNVYAPSLNDADGLKFEDSSNTFIVQPVVPITGGDKLPFDIIFRPTWQAAVTTSDVSSKATGEGLVNGTTAVGDTSLLSFAVFNTKWGKVGAGVSNVFPTGTDRRTSSSKWQAGPAGLVIAHNVPNWTLGVLAYHDRSFASSRSDAEDKSVTSIQPIAIRHFEGGWYAGLGDEVYTYDWRDEKVNLPVNFRFGKVFQIGGQHLNVFGQPAYNVNSSGPGTPEYSFKVNVTFLLPEISLGWKHAEDAK